MNLRFLGLLLALTPTSVVAQTTVELRSDFESFDHVPMQSEHLFGTRTNRTLSHFQLGAGLAFNGQDDPVVLRFEDGSEWRVVDHRLTAQLYAALGVSDWVELAIAAPFILSQDTDTQPADYRATPVIGPVAGDLKLHGHLTWLDTEGFGLGTSAVLSLPTGSDDALASTGSVRVEPALVLDYRNDVFAIAANVSYASRPAATTLNFVADDQIRWSLAADVTFARPLHLAASAFGSVGLGDAIEGQDARDMPAEFLVGPRLFLPAGLMFHAAGGTSITSSVGAPDFRVIAGLEWIPPMLEGRKVDHDEVLASSQQPDESLELPDCAAQPDAPACPLVDGDDDGIADHLDRCPNAAEDADGFMDDDGCPDPDNDQDGILDASDACPLEAENINGVSDEDGCPDEGASKVRVTADRIDILERVYFDTNKDTIQARSFGVLEQVATVLKSRPAITRVRVEGHTDDRGNDTYNLDLSQRRAAAVRQFLIDRGVEAERLVARGYGESHPVGDNKTADGRDMNRRVEFHIIAEEP